VQARPQPDGDLLRAQRLGQRILAHHGAVRQVARRARGRFAQQLRTHGAAQPVSADEGVCLHGQRLRAGALQLRGDGVPGLHIARERVAQVQLHRGQALHGRQQQRQQVGAVDGGVGCAVALGDVRAQAQAGQRGAAGRAAHEQPVRKGGDLPQRVQQAPVLQPPHRVGTQLHAGAHLGEGRRALVQAHLPVGARTGQRGGEPADAAAGDHDLVLHGGIVRAGPTLPALARSGGASRAQPAGVSARSSVDTGAGRPNR